MINIIDSNLVNYCRSLTDSQLLRLVGQVHTFWIVYITSPNVHLDTVQHRWIDQTEVTLRFIETIRTTPYYRELVMPSDEFFKALNEMGFVPSAIPNVQESTNPYTYEKLVTVIQNDIDCKKQCSLTREEVTRCISSDNLFSKLGSIALVTGTCFELRQDGTILFTKNI